MDTYFYFQELSNTEELIKEIPKHWERHDDLIIFPINSFSSPIWATLNPEFWHKMGKILKAERLGKKSVISNDNFRSPHVQIFLGSDNLWATRKENGIFYTWNFTKSMFSVGNISEKQRISKFNCQNQIVVDLFAGIGYFTLSYLIHSKAAHVFACEWNPEAVKALKINLQKNKVQPEKCTVLEGDNRETCPQNVADHVNLGLLPDRYSSNVFRDSKFSQNSV